MKVTLTTRGLVRVISFGSAVVLAFGGFAWKNYARAQDYRWQLEAGYSRSLGELSSYLTNIAADLEKGQYVGTPVKLSQLSARVWKESGGAKEALGGLPVAQMNLEGTYKFLSQVGDYAMAMSRKVGAGQTLSEEEIANARALCDYAGRLRDYVDAVQRQVEIGQISFSALSARQLAQSDPELGAAAGFSDAEQVMAGYPTLIYDGPFSDHLLTRAPKAIRGLPGVSVAQAREVAAIAARVKPDDLVRQEDENSNMPSYTFGVGEVCVGVTKGGGKVSYLLSNRSTGERRLNQQAVFERASAYLTDLGLEGMRPTYYENAEGVCTINFAAEQDNVRLYTDLVKVGVALDDGGIVFYDARGYLSNHYERTLPQPTLTAAQASESVAPVLEVRSDRLALIPTEGKGEVLTYEFLTRVKDDPKRQILVYINALTGAEENILLLLETPNGTLTK